MYRNNTNLLFRIPAIVAVAFLICPSIAGQPREMTCSGRVVDTDGRPIAEARVILYQITYDYIANTAESTVRGEVRTAGDGAFSFDVAVEGDEYRNAYVVADKEGLALGWAEWRMLDDQQQDIALGEPGQLSGTVVDEAGRAVPDANVSVWTIAVGEGQGTRRLDRPVDGQLLKASTDSSGRFTLTRIPADATADFVVRKRGRATLTTFRSTGHANQRMTYAVGQDDIKSALSAEARIRGTVVVADSGKPIAGVKLIVRTAENRPVWEQEPATSGDDGAFGFDALAAGTYTVHLVRPQQGLAGWVAEPVSVELEKGLTKTDVKMEVSKGGLLEIATYDAGTGKPLAGASVSIRDEKNSMSHSVRSAEDGAARIRLMPGRYQISGVYRQGYKSDRRQEDVTIELGSTKRKARALDKMPRITGTVRDATGRPAEGVRFQILPRRRQDVRSDSQGRFECVWDPGFWGDREDTVFCLVARDEKRNLAAAMEIAEGTAPLDLKLQPGITFVGKVADPAGRGIPNAQVRAMLRVSKWGAPLSRDVIEADEDGKYEIRAIPPGQRYSVNAEARGYGQRSVAVHADDAVNNRLTIETMALAVANLSLSGQIVDLQGKPVADAAIEGYGVDQPNCRTQSDTNGYFTLDGFCEGMVYVRVVVGGGSNRLSAYVRTDAGATGIKIPVRRGRSASYYIPGKTDEQIIRSYERAIAGVALDERGQPVPGVPVSVCCHQKKTEDGRNSWHYSSFSGLSDITDERGHFAIAIEEDGKYNLRFSPDNHAAVIIYDIPTGKTDLKVTLPDGGTIAGRLVRLTRGKKVPVPHAEVKLEQTDRASYTHLGFDRDRTTRTDEQGRFRFEHVRTKIRPRGTRTDEHWNHEPRVWQITCGETSKTVAFYDGTHIEDFELVLRPDPANSQPLLGAAMPEFDDIKIDLPPNYIAAKSVLLCFFDMNQRPSRHCVAQLAKRADQLHEKGVAIVAVQASDVDQSKLSEWILKNVAAVPVGVARGEIDEMRATWAVQSLPWLILTDTDHVVRTEGFGLNELDTKIKEITAKQ